MRLSYFILAVVLALPAAAPAADSVDWIVATVNDEAVLRSEVLAERQVIANLLAGSDRPQLSLGQLSEIAVENLINQKLQLQRADSLGIRASPQRIERILEQLRADAGGASLEQLAALDGLTAAELRRRITNEVRINDAMLSDSEEELGVTVDQVNELLRARLRRPGQREYLLEHAHLPPGSEQVAQSLRGVPADEFAAAAQEHHVGEEPVALGWLSEDKLAALYIAEVRRLRAGEISEVLEFDDGLRVLHLVAVRPLVPGSVQRESVKLQLLTVGESADAQQLENTKTAIMEGELDFAGAAAAISGELAVVDYQVGELPAPLAQGLRLRIGEIGGPFDLPEGLAIAQVLSVKQRTVGDDNLHRQALSTMSNINIERARRKWIEYLHSIGTVNIVRANL